MNLIGKQVIHKTLGKGTVTEQIIKLDKIDIIVQFASKTSQFQYPEAFKSFLKVDDAMLDEEIKADIAANDAKVEEEKQRKREVSEALWKKRIEEITQKSTNNASGKKIKRIARVEGQFLTFLVFQGNTYDAESKGGYIWAPKYNHGGGTFHHWDKLMDVRKGDMILHCVNGYIRAISIAKDACCDEESPIELTQEQLWAKNGRMVECDYIEIEHPIKHSDYKNEILQYCNVKYAPFDKDGNGNMGYLFDLDRELAKFFVREMAAKNGYLLNYNFIQEILK